VTSISWNHEGTVFASSCKDKKLRIVDPRAGKATAVRLFLSFFLFLSLCGR